MSAVRLLDKTPIWLRYVGVMGASWVVDFAAFGLVGLFFDIPVSQAIARGCGAVTGFLLHKFGTFRQPPNVSPGSGTAQSQQTRGLSQVFAYVALWVFGWITSTLGILLILEWTALNKFIAKLAVETMLVPVNYLAMRRFVFRL